MPLYYAGYDTDYDGIIDSSEIELAGELYAPIVDIMKEFDVDNDGDISLDDFYTAFI